MQDGTFKLLSSVRRDGVDRYRLNLRRVCLVATDGITPGMIKDAKRLVEKIYDAHVFDGGADGLRRATADDAVFLSARDIHPIRI